MGKSNITVEYIKSLGNSKNRSRESLDLLFQLFSGDYNIELKREIVSSIGRQTLNDEVLNFIDAIIAALPFHLCVYICQWRI